MAQPWLGAQKGWVLTHLISGAPAAPEVISKAEQSTLQSCETRH